MHLFGFGGTVAAAGILTLVVAPFTATPADARGHASHGGRSQASYSGASYGSAHYSRVSYTRHTRPFSGYTRSYGGGSLQCVPFARENTGIELSGNAATWWGAAQGVYERGARPEVGSILNFRATGHMRLGHVAVVSSIVNARTVLIDHANWSSRGAINRDTSVVDVSPDNDWTAVRVAISQGGELGSVYPTYGFIYDRPDRGTMVANVGATPTPTFTSTQAQPTYRMAAARMPIVISPVTSVSAEPEEVAEAADDSDDAQPRFRRVGRRLIHVPAVSRTVTRGNFRSDTHMISTRFAHTYGSTLASPSARSVTRAAARPAQVIRIRSTSTASRSAEPQTHSPSRRHTRG